MKMDRLVRTVEEVTEIVFQDLLILDKTLTLSLKILALVRRGTRIILKQI